MGHQFRLEEAKDRERDRDQDPFEHAEEHHAQRGCDRQQESRRSDTQELGDGRDVDQREPGGDHDRRQGRVRKVREQVRQQDQHDRHQRRADQSGHLTLCAALLGDRSARSARRDGEPLEEPGEGVGGADPDHLLVASTSSPRLAAKLVEVAIVSASETTVIPIAAASSTPRSLERDRRELGHGSPCGSDPTVVTPLSVRSKRGTARVEEDDGDQHGRDPSREARQNQEHGERCQTDRQRVAVAAVKPVEELPHVVHEVSPSVGEAEQLRELTHDDRDAQADHVADLNLLREQVGHEAQLPEPQPDLDRGDQQRQHPSENDQLSGVVSDRERHNRDEDQRAE